MLWFLIGFCVVIIKNVLFSGYVWLLIVIWCFVIVLKRVFCVCGVVWLILLVSRIFENIGLCWNLNFWVFWLNMLKLVMFVGSRFGVYWIWVKWLFIVFVIVLVKVVLLRFGRLLNNKCLWVKRYVIMFLMMLFLLINVWLSVECKVLMVGWWWLFWVVDLLVMFLVLVIVEVFLLMLGGEIRCFVMELNRSWGVDWDCLLVMICWIFYFGVKEF